MVEKCGWHPRAVYAPPSHPPSNSMNTNNFCFRGVGVVAEAQDFPKLGCTPGRSAGPRGMNHMIQIS